MAGKTMRQALSRLAQAARRYAAQCGWSPNDYKLYVNINEEWRQFHLVLVAKTFPGENPEDHWLSFVEFLEKDLKDDRALLDSLHINLRTFAQVDEGGMYAIGEEFLDIEDLLAESPLNK